ncbi:trypsin 3A1-like [Haematobia irritans]|uniref:trypsin 3A1-like n=1 Tax=Haematobia irritans TaxID=7368 RepID=UPI003F50B31A
MKSEISFIFAWWLLVQVGAIYDGTQDDSNPREGRIVGGWETSISYFPYQVSLQISNRHICGASIIREDLVLTAAHCVDHYSNPYLYTIRAGSSYHYMGGIIVPVKEIVKHENYNKTINDIALLKLQMPLVYNGYVQAIQLMEETGTLKEYQELWVSGWGTQHSAIPQVSPVLRYTTVNKIPPRICYESYKALLKINKNMLCAGVDKGGRDSCQGDSGGPLIARSTIDSSPRLVGVVSFGVDCAKAQYPGVYTRVQMYHQWLNETIEKLK